MATVSIGSSEGGQKVKSYLGSYICGERLKHKLNTAQLAEMIGYKNLNKGMRRITALEREGTASPALLEKVVDVLELDAGYIYSLIRKDREAYEADLELWLKEPIKMYYTIRMMPTIYLSYELPSDIKTEDEAIRFVAGIAKEKHNKCWVVLSRKEKVYITEDGEVGGKVETKYGDEDYPYMRVR
jgi:transcriptional regulator with XRE-family HTH domain